MYLHSARKLPPKTKHGKSGTGNPAAAAPPKNLSRVKESALEYYQKDSKDKKIGEFFTPRHLIEMMVALVKPEIKFRKDDKGKYITDKNGNREIEYVEKIYDEAVA